MCQDVPLIIVLTKIVKTCRFQVLIFLKEARIQENIGKIVWPGIYRTHNYHRMKIFWMKSILLSQIMLFIFMQISVLIWSGEAWEWRNEKGRKETPSPYWLSVGSWCWWSEDTPAHQSPVMSVRKSHSNIISTLQWSSDILGPHQSAQLNY